MKPRVFARRQRAGNDGRRVRFDQPLGTRVLWFRSLATALAGLLIVGFVLDWHSTIADEGQRLLVRAFPNALLDTIDGLTAESDDGPDGTASNVVDSGPTPWEPVWPADAATDAGACGSTAGTNPQVVINFDPSTTIDRVTVIPGRPEDDPTRLIVARPARLDLLYNGHCEPIEIPDSPDAVRHFIQSSGEVSYLTVIIAAVHAAPPGGEDTVAIQELAFERR